MERSSDVFVDGTSSVVPRLFFQLYTVHGEYMSSVCQMVYALLSGNVTLSNWQDDPTFLAGEKRKFYDEMLKAITDSKPITVTMDLEPATIVSIRTAFPRVNVKSCFFHLCQSACRAVVRLRLKTNYTDDPIFAPQIRALLSLAFLHANDVIDIFEELKQQFPVQGQSILSYFEETYIGEEGYSTRSRKKPQFDLNIWNIHG